MNSGDNVQVGGQTSSVTRQESAPLLNTPTTCYTLRDESILDVLRIRDPCVRQALLEIHLPNVTYWQRVLQTGGLAQMYICSKRISETFSMRNQHFHDVNISYEGVLSNCQQTISLDDFEDLRGHDLLANLSHQPITRNVYRCSRWPSESQFIVKEFNHINWHPNMELPLYCGSGSIVRPLAILFNYQSGYILQPYLKGQTLTEFVSKRSTRLSVSEADFICYQLLDCLKDLAEVNLVHRTISPCHIVLPRDNPIVSLVGYGAMSLLGNAPSWIPESITTNYYVAPELVRGEEHTAKCDVYSLGSAVLSGLVQRIPFFNIGRSQVNNYSFRIATGEINPHNVLRGIQQYYRHTERPEMIRLAKILWDMTIFDQNYRLSAYDVIRRHYSRNPVPEYRQVFFRTRTMSPEFDPIHIPIPNLNAVAVLPQNGIRGNIPSPEILESAEIVDQQDLPLAVPPHIQNRPVAVADQSPAQVPVPKSPGSLHNHDSGRDTAGGSPITCIVVDDGTEIARFNIPSNMHGLDVYKIVQSMPQMGPIQLHHDGEILQFETCLDQFEQNTVVFDLVRIQRERRTQRRQEGAAYNGDDHVDMESF